MKLQKYQRAILAAAKRDQANMKPLDLAALDRAVEEKKARDLAREKAAEAMRGAVVEKATASAGMIFVDEVIHFEEIFSGMAPRSAEEIRAWDLKNVIFPRVKSWGFEDRYLREIADFQNEEQAATLEICRRQLCGVGAVVALIGKRGTGKTTIAAQLALARAWEVQRARECGGPGATAVFSYWKTTKLVQRFKPLYANFGATNLESLEDSLVRLCAHEVLVIDEMHDLSELAVREALLIDVIDRRYAGLRDTLLISNQTPEEWEAQTPASIQSRIQEHGSVLKCEWDSWRAKGG